MLIFRIRTDATPSPDALPLVVGGRTWYIHVDRIEEEDD